MNSNLRGLLYFYLSGGKYTSEIKSLAELWFEKVGWHNGGKCFRVESHFLDVYI